MVDRDIGLQVHFRDKRFVFSPTAYASYSQLLQAALYAELEQAGSLAPLSSSFFYFPVPVILFCFARHSFQALFCVCSFPQSHIGQSLAGERTCRPSGHSQGQMMLCQHTHTPCYSVSQDFVCCALCVCYFCCDKPCVWRTSNFPSCNYLLNRDTEVRTNRLQDHLPSLAGLHKSLCFAYFQKIILFLFFYLLRQIYYKYTAREKPIVGVPTPNRDLSAFPTSESMENLRI